MAGPGLPVDDDERETEIDYDDDCGYFPAFDEGCWDDNDGED